MNGVSSIGAMCSSHKQAFRKVAQAMKVWILVRATNRSSLQYMGPAWPNVVPKPLGCKAKTADAGPKAGLVVCPELDSSAFSSEKLGGVINKWKEWAPEWFPVQFERSFLKRHFEGDSDHWVLQGNIATRGLPHGYGVIHDPDDPYFGCIVTFVEGDRVGRYDAPKMMHGDYDLYDIVDPEDHDCRRRALEVFNGAVSRFGPKTVEVAKALNKLMSDGRASTDLIQHGEHLAEFAKHTDDMIFVFSPFQEDADIVIHSFGQGTRSVVGIYEKIFSGRRPRGEN